MPLVLALWACGVIDIGDNLTKVLVGIGGTITTLMPVVVLWLTKKVHTEVKQVHVDTSTTAAIMTGTPTPPNGTPTTKGKQDAS